MPALSSLRHSLGRHAFRPLYDYLARLERALSGDLVLVCSPATKASSAAAVTTAIAGAGFTRTVTVSLKNAAGDVHDWYDGTFAIAVSESTAGNGVSAIVGGGSTVTLVDGVGSVDIAYTGNWAAADTQTLTVTGGTKLGYTISNKTSVDTLVA